MPTAAAANKATEELKLYRSQLAEIVVFAPTCIVYTFT